MADKKHESYKQSEICICFRRAELFSKFCLEICCVVFAETVVAESVVVIKKLLQTQPTQHGDIIKLMAKLFDNITVRFRWDLLVIFLHCRYQHRVTFLFCTASRSPWPEPASCG